MIKTYKRLLLAALFTAGFTGIQQTQAQMQQLTLERRVATGTDDAEENMATGSIDLTSSDLELVYDGFDQYIGIRFTDIKIPQGATITKAYIQFAIDEFHSGATSVVIKGQAHDNASTFTSNTKDISSRALNSSSVNWNNIAPWLVQDQAGADQATPDLKTVIQEIVNRGGWKSGNALAVVITGSGRRNAHAYNGSATLAPKLVIEYEGVGQLPVAKLSSWKYNDKGIDLGTSWKDASFNDAAWAEGKAVLGYGDPVTTTLSFGGNSSNKYPTYYLRHAFEVTNVKQYDTLVFDIRRDDGAVVYLNGIEQFRTNMPTGTITYNTWASATTDAANETTYFRFKVPASALKDGKNVLAVEVHQDRASSSDVTFDMEVNGQVKPPKQDAEVFALGVDWKYLDNGSDQNTSWINPSFNDSTWKTGSGVFGYGNGDEKTVINYGTDAADKHITTYFRKTFNVADTAEFKSLQLNLIRDDAAIIYLNGVEVFRSNMVNGTVNYKTTALSFIEGADETTPVTAFINKSLLKLGENVLAVEVHKFSNFDSDLRFDLGMKLVVNQNAITSSGGNVVCDPKSSDKIGCFTSVQPTAQTQLFVYPEASHTFQVIAKSGVTEYTSGGTGTIPGGNDFTGYVPFNGSSTKGTVSINHENGTGAVTHVGLHFNEETMLWEVDSVHKVDFSQVVKTATNCSGGITPWGTVITSEETFSTGDANTDGYVDIGWQVEIDPKTGKIRDYDGDGKPDKLWAMGRMAHENIAVSNDSTTAYQAEDGGTGCVYKFIADKKADLSSGTLYVLKRDSATATTGTWIQVPNTSQADRNNTRNIAGTLGGTNWSGPEDIEFGPDGMIYFTAKGTGIIWRFKDNGTKVSAVEAWVTNKQYAITHSNGTQNESWGTGIDNLTFDGEGNLWAQQDGGRGHLWLIRPDHTPANPHVELFATTPAGSEPTGLTFTPDFRYGFISFQHPSGANTATYKDAAGNDVRYNAPTTVVFARKEYLGAGAIEPKFDLGADIVSCQGETVALKANAGNDVLVKWNGSNVTDSVLNVTTSGTYYATAYANNGKTYTDSIKVTFAVTPVANLGTDVKQCGGNVTLDAGNANAGMQYLWSDNSTTQKITVTKSGSYVVNVINPITGCVSTDTVNVTIHDMPVLNIGDDMNICSSCTLMLNAGSGFKSYAWNTGATTQIINVTEPGTYYVTVTDANGCTATDSIKIQLTTGIENVEANAAIVEVYPNPFRNATQIKLNLPENASVKLEVFDINGRIIKTLTDSKLSSGDHTFDFNPTVNVQGIYFLRLSVNNQLITKKLIRLND